MIPLNASVRSQAFLEDEPQTVVSSDSANVSDLRRKLLSGDWARLQTFSKRPLFPELLSGVSYSDCVRNRARVRTTIAFARVFRLRHPEFFDETELSLVDRAMVRSYAFTLTALSLGGMFALLDYKALAGRPSSPALGVLAALCAGSLAAALAPTNRIVSPLLQLDSPAGALLRATWNHAPAVARDLGYSPLHPFVHASRVDTLLRGLGDIASEATEGGGVMPGRGAPDRFEGRGRSLRYSVVPSSLRDSALVASSVSPTRRPQKDISQGTLQPPALLVELAQGVSASALSLKHFLTQPPSLSSFPQRFANAWRVNSHVSFLPKFLPWRYDDFDVEAAIEVARRQRARPPVRHSFPRKASPPERERELPRGVRGEEASLLRAENDKYRYASKAPSFTLLPKSWREKQEAAVVYTDRVV